MPYHFSRHVMIYQPPVAAQSAGFPVPIPPAPCISANHQPLTFPAALLPDSGALGNLCRIARMSAIFRVPLPRRFSTCAAGTICTFALSWPNKNLRRLFLRYTTSLSSRHALSAMRKGESLSSLPSPTSEIFPSSFHRRYNQMQRIGNLPFQKILRLMRKASLTLPIFGRLH